MLKDHPKKYHELIGLMEQLGSKIPNTMGAFEQLHISGIADGMLNKKTKELIALGIAITVRCDGCIAFHVHDALESGATSNEIVETIGVAVLMGGGPAVVYGCEALEALEQFSILSD
ncbi:carboxymuconolactone decarboxylase family protein [Muricauda sp. MAR_2010_75]|uniref:carboxymuconolactone decarboxylase family protein n=1 Tax=Allomuricauda sp. MAR_2010_75 TaxID=1250232 RepID=UPI00055A46C4|nr:carboxymuconolactone decarboxylase family protein [Muricauda sp. MAR_2010_75]